MPRPRNAAPDSEPPFRKYVPPPPSVALLPTTRQPRIAPSYNPPPLFVAMKTKPVWFTEDQLKAHVKADYRPGR